MTPRSRRFRSSALLGAATAALTLAALPANAAIMLFTRTFTIYGGSASDPTLINRVRNTQLKVAVKVDTDQGAFEPKDPTDRVEFVHAFFQNPVLEIAYEFDGFPVVISGAAIANGSGNISIENVQDPRQDNQNLFMTREYVDQGQLLGLGAEMFATLPTGAIGLDLTKPFSAGAKGAGRFSYFHLRNGVRESGNLILTAPPLGAGLDSAANDFDASIQVERLDTAVPEPATWALMISGFGLAGAALRRRGAAVRI